jgi:hypothetical protein
LPRTIHTPFAFATEELLQQFFDLQLQLAVLLLELVVMLFKLEDLVGMLFDELAFQ